MEIGVQAITATNGTKFTYGNEADLLCDLIKSYKWCLVHVLTVLSLKIDLTSGTSRDYTYVGDDKILYPYTIETRDAAYGFVAPPREILPTAREIWNGIKAMANAVQ